MVPRNGFEPSTVRVWTVCSSQLSYLGMVEISGIEPLTYAVQVRRSPKLSYIPLMIWSGKRGSNSRHSAWKADALPTELFPHYSSQELYYHNIKFLSSFLIEIYKKNIYNIKWYLKLRWWYEKNYYSWWSSCWNECCC